VYLIYTNIGVKIGKSISPKERIKTLSKSSPVKFIGSDIFKVKNMHQTEALLHRKYKNRQINGEWFNLEKEQIEDIQEALKV
jgi:hypothetical protein